MPHRQEPRPANKRDAEWAVIARAAELVDYITKPVGGLKHITEVRLIEAVRDLRELEK